MAEEYGVPLPEPEKKGFKIDWKILVMVAIIVIILVVTSVIRGKTPKIDDDCCQRICDRVGTGLVCDFHQSNYVWCNLNYAKYGVPNASEVFRFEIHDIESMCGFEPQLVVTPVNETRGGGGAIPARELGFCDSVNDCFMNNSLEGCEQMDCNWCCNNECSLLGCGVNITKIEEG